MHWCSTKQRNRKKGICGESNCEGCVKNSCAGHELFNRCWNPENELKPFQVALNCTKIIKFICDKGHPVEIRPNHYIAGNHWCGVCAKGKDLFSDHDLSKYISPNNKLNIVNVGCGSHKHITLQCPTCKKDHTDEIRYFVKNTKNRCSCFPKVDYKPKMTKEQIIERIKRCWDKTNTVTFENITYGSSEKVKFNCDVCHHTFTKEYKHAVNGTWCEYCANQKLCNDNSCQNCFNKSFASHPRAEFWSKNNTVTPRMIFKGVSDNYKFNCKECKHEFSLCPMSINQKNRWCNYCSNTYLCDDENCKMCFENSFASYQHNDKWSSKNQVTPRQVFKSVAKHFWFECHRCGNEYEQRLDNKVCGRNSCPKCLNKTELKLYEWLLQRFPDVEKEAKAEWLKMNNSKHSCRLDFYIPSLKLAIELDGVQHTEQVMNWESPEEIRKRDTFKMTQCILRQISTIRVNQDDVFYDKNNWGTIMEKEIKNIQEPCIVTIKRNKTYTFRVEKQDLDIIKTLFKN